MSEAEIRVRPTVGACGAEISGIDLRRPLDNEAFAAVHDALLHHRLILFRDQQLGPDEMKALASRFGPLDEHPYIQPIEGHPEVLRIVKEPGDRVNFGGGWHSEVSFYEKPAMGTMLYAVDVPGAGGDTLVADMVAAYAALSPTMQGILEGLTAIHSAEHIYGSKAVFATEEAKQSTSLRFDASADAKVEHPLVRTHPETGEKILYVNPAFTVGIRGMKKRESDALLQFLFTHQTATEYCTRIHWQPGTLAFWDNRSTQHYALNDYAGHRREMLRVVVAGDRPA
jgi:taurine dioxygenase